MAMTPNFSIRGATPPGTAAPSADGKAGDMFAQILSLSPLAGGTGETPLADLETPEIGAETEVGSEEEVEFLAALPESMPLEAPVVPVAAPVPAPQPAGDPAAPAPAAQQLADPAPQKPVQSRIAQAAKPHLTAAIPTSAGPGATAPADAAQPLLAGEAAAKSVPAAPSQPHISKSAPAPIASPSEQPIPASLREPARAALAAARPETTVDADRPSPAGPSTAAPPAPAFAPAVFTGPTPQPAELAAAAETRAPDPGEMQMEHELDLAQESEWLDRLARDIARTGGEGRMRFRLHPETLGHLRVEIAQTDQGASIRLTAESEAARAAIADAQPRLVAEARAQGVRIAETQVDLGSRGETGEQAGRHAEEQREPHLRTARRSAASGAVAPDAAAPPRATTTDRYA